MVLEDSISSSSISITYTGARSLSASASGLGVDDLVFRVFDVVFGLVLGGLDFGFVVVVVARQKKPVLARLLVHTKRVWPSRPKTFAPTLYSLAPFNGVRRVDVDIILVGRRRKGG